MIAADTLTLVELIVAVCVGVILALVAAFAYSTSLVRRIGDLTPPKRYDAVLTVEAVEADGTPHEPPRVLARLTTGDLGRLAHLGAYGRAGAVVDTFAGPIRLTVEPIGSDL